MLKKLIILCLFSLLPTTSLFAATSLTFEWNPNSESDLKGYKLYEKNSDNTFTFLKDILAPAITETITTNDGDHEYVLTAYDQFNNESEYSDSVAITTDSIPPGMPKQLKITLQIIVNP